MKITKIDKGQSFDWGKTSEDYAKYRDIYPQSLYEKLLAFNIGKKGQKILDLGTGTGVLPRAMYSFGADFTGSDASKNQIEIAKKLAKNEKKHINFKHYAAEDIDFHDNSFDVITAVQCWWYFNLDILIPKLKRILKTNGKLVIINMHWLPEEDDLVKASESLILKYNALWTGGGTKRIQMKPAQFAQLNFKTEKLYTYDAAIPFSRASWLGRIRASRGVGATLNKKQLRRFDTEHRKWIATLRSEHFTVLHQITIEIYKLL